MLNPTDPGSLATDQVDSTKPAVAESFAGQLECTKAVDDSQKGNDDVDKRGESAAAELAVARRNLDWAKAELAKTQQDLSDEQDEHRASRYDLQRLQDDFDDLQERYDEEQEQKSIDQHFATQSAQDTQAHHEELKGRYNDTKKQCDALTKQLFTAEAEVVKGRNARGELQRQFKDVKKECTNLTQKLSTVETELLTARNAHEKLQSQYNSHDKDCCQQLTRKGTELSNAQSDLESVRVKEKELKNKLSATEADLSSSRQALEKLQTRFNNMEREHQKANDRCNKLEKDYEELDTAHHKACEHYNKLDKDYRELDVAMQHLNKEYRDVQVSLVTRETEMAKLASQHKEQGEDLTQANEREKERKHRAKIREKHVKLQDGELLDLRKEQKYLQTKNTNLEADVKNMETRYSAMAARNSKLLESNQDLEKKVKGHEKVASRHQNALGVQRMHWQARIERETEELVKANAVLEQERSDTCQAFSVLKDQYDNFQVEHSQMKDDYEALVMKLKNGGKAVQKRVRKKKPTQEEAPIAEEASQPQLHDEGSIAGDEASQNGHPLIDQLRSASPSMAQQGGQGDGYLNAILESNHYDSSNQVMIWSGNPAEAIHLGTGDEPANLGAVDTGNNAQGIPPINDSELFDQQPTRAGLGAGNVAPINHNESPGQVSGDDGDNAQAIPTAKNNKPTAHLPTISEAQAGATSPAPNNDPTNQPLALAEPRRSRTAGILGLLLLIVTLALSIGLAVYMNACFNYDAIMTRADDTTRAMLLSQRMGGGTGTIQPAWLGRFFDDVVVDMIPGEFQPARLHCTAKSVRILTIPVLGLYG